MGILVRSGWYYFVKRVPKTIKPFENRNLIRIALKTKTKFEALKKAVAIEEELIANWNALKNSAKNNDEVYSRAYAIANMHGFSYRDTTQLTGHSPSDELIKRIDIAFKHLNNDQISDALLGTAKLPKVSIKKSGKLFWDLCTDRFINKSDHQITKYKNPRLLALKEFENIVGNKQICEVSRSDILKFHKWLLQKIGDGTSPDTANKKMRYVKDILKTVCRSKEIPFDEDRLFKDTRFKLQKKSRPPFEADYVQNTILPNLNTLNKDAKYLVFAMADTGAREAELIGLDKEDIVLDAPVPHIYIRPKEKRSLKTPHSERKIPLVGAALHAFKQCPNGFTRYKEADSISNLVNKYMRTNNLRPTEKHSLYSLRHTFKDRLRDIGAPEEIIDQMMGHRSYKPKYGRGHKLESAQMWLNKIAFKVEEPQVTTCN